MRKNGVGTPCQELLKNEHQENVLRMAMAKGEPVRSERPGEANAIEGDSMAA